MNFHHRLCRRGHPTRLKKALNRDWTIAHALAEAKTRNEQRLAEEGYHHYARESVEFAQASALAAAEAIAPYTVWEDDD